MTAVRRSRSLLVVALGCVVALGLLSRRYPLPGILAEYTGDALYAVAAFLGIALAWTAARTLPLALSAWGFAAAVELSQLLRWPWLLELRVTRFGSLALGHGFQWADLAAYAIGILVVALLDLVWVRQTSAGRNFSSD